LNFHVLWVVALMKRNLHFVSYAWRSQLAETDHFLWFVQVFSLTTDLTQSKVII